MTVYITRQRGFRSIIALFVSYSNVSRSLLGVPGTLIVERLWTICFQALVSALCTLTLTYVPYAAIFTNKSNIRAHTYTHSLPHVKRTSNHFKLPGVSTAIALIFSVQRYFAPHTTFETSIIFKSWLRFRKGNTMNNPISGEMILIFIACVCVCGLYGANWGFVRQVPGFNCQCLQTGCLSFLIYAIDTQVAGRQDRTHSFWCTGACP